MYIRFVSARPHPLVHAEAGLFEAYWHILDTADARLGKKPGRLQERMPRHRTLRRRWIALPEAGRNLSSLGRPQLSGPDRVKGGKRALFWFRANAGWRRGWDEKSTSPGTVIFDARELAHRLTVWGIEIREITTRSPGQVLWQDEHQVLAVPEKPVPRAFS